MIASHPVRAFRLRKAAPALLVPLLIVFACVATTPASGSGFARTPRSVVPVHLDQLDWARLWHAWVLAGGGDQGMPPPLALRPYFPRFVPLYLTYISIPPSKPSFAQWLILHGVIDPVTHQAMMLLYEWAERNG